MTAALLAGGQSRRFGSDKALARLGGVTLLECSAASLEGAPHRLLIAPPERSYQLPGWITEPEDRQGEGPLAGLEKALTWAEQFGSGWVALTGVDYPLLTPAVWATLFLHVGEGRLAVATLDAAGHPQPLPALYHTALRPEVTAALDRGERRLRAVLQGPGRILLSRDALGLSSHVWEDADTAADLERLARFPQASVPER
ncbi:molybdenum cofactor guanylyltransferase [Deinococcus radiophilus]|uniref:Molybdenum cofactor guanylyltransferase n=1 Tax=Deinococcus radiophilus TaxID=32062 RepID=A0A3S0I7Z2_9DEIO|nr:molybdenum cofactor guanylyltransferase [Deinococcus radiophilus]